LIFRSLPGHQRSTGRSSWLVVRRLFRPACAWFKVMQRLPAVRGPGPQSGPAAHRCRRQRTARTEPAPAGYPRQPAPKDFRSKTTHRSALHLRSGNVAGPCTSSDSFAPPPFGPGFLPARPAAAMGARRVIRGPGAGRPQQPPTPPPRTRQRCKADRRLRRGANTVQGISRHRFPAFLVHRVKTGAPDRDGAALECT